MWCRTISLTEVSPEDLDRWRRLADTAIEPNPNADPRFLHPSLGFGLFAEDVELAIVESGDEFALVMPFTRARRLSGVPVRHVTTSGEFILDHASRDHPLVSPEDPVAAMRALFCGLREAGASDLLNLTVFPADGPLHTALEMLRSEGTIRFVERARDRRAYARRVELDPTGAPWPTVSTQLIGYPLPHLSKRTRRNVRKNVEQIEALTGVPLSITARDDDHEVIDEFFELQATGWKGDASQSGPQYRRWGREQWFRSVLDAFHADGHLRVWHVAAGDETLFISLNLMSGRVAFGFQDVYNERFQRYSPGTIGRLAELGATLRDPKVPVFDPCMEPKYPQASSAYPSSREYADLLVAGRSLRSRAVVATFPAAKRVRTLARSAAARRSN